MNVSRRNFLGMLGLGVTAVAAPKFIFDMGANLYRLPNPDHRIVMTTFDFAHQYGMALEFKWKEQTYRHAVRFNAIDLIQTPHLMPSLGEKALLDWKADKIRRLVLG